LVEERSVKLFGERVSRRQVGMQRLNMSCLVKLNDLAVQCYTQPAALTRGELDDVGVTFFVRQRPVVTAAARHGRSDFVTVNLNEDLAAIHEVARRISNRAHLGAYAMIMQSVERSHRCAIPGLSLRSEVVPAIGKSGVLYQWSGTSSQHYCNLGLP